MEINVLNRTKNKAEIEISHLTIAELLRVYLNQDSSVVFAAWKKEHPTKNPVLKIKTKDKTVKKAIDDAVSRIIKELNKIEKDFEKLKI